MYKKLFSEKKIGGLRIKNRIVMTAMGNHMAAGDGFNSDTNTAFYAERAKGGVGLIITECIYVEPLGKSNLRGLSLHDDAYIPGLRKLTEAVHKYDSAIVAQIYHPGRQGIAAINGGSMKSVSGTECQCVRQQTHEMTLDDITQLRGRFIDAAGRAKEAGFDAVEIHGAHGYIINEFLSPYTNRRIDRYGGSFENRIRFLDEIIAGVRRVCGQDFPILVRFSADENLWYIGLECEGLHLGDGIAIAKHLEKQGVDTLDITCGIYETNNTSWEPVSFDEGWKIDNAAAIREAVSIPVIGVSVIRNPAYAERILEEGKVDFVGSARQFFADPEWANKAREGRENEIRKCISCLYCMESLCLADVNHIDMGCAINFQGGRELIYGDDCLVRNGEGRTVAIVGGGPAGLEAAIVLAKRGFKPIVLEKRDQLGGQVVFAAKPPKKEKMNWLIDYYQSQLEKYKVEVRLNTAPTLSDIQALNPYAVLIAQGSVPAMPRSIPGLDGANVYTPIDVLNEKVSFSGKNICVVGSGLTGLETAELLGSQGNSVRLFEMAGEIGPGVYSQNLIDVMKRIEEYKVELYPGHRLLDVHENMAVFERSDTKERVKFLFDALVVSLGVVPNMDLVEDLKRTFSNVVLIGDADRVGRLESAVSTGYRSTFSL